MNIIISEDDIFIFGLSNGMIMKCDINQKSIISQIIVNEYNVKCKWTFINDGAYLCTGKY